MYSECSGFALFLRRGPLKSNSSSSSVAFFANDTFFVPWRIAIRLVAAVWCLIVSILKHTASAKCVSAALKSEISGEDSSGSKCELLILIIKIIATDMQNQSSNCFPPLPAAIRRFFNHIFKLRYAECMFALACPLSQALPAPVALRQLSFFWFPRDLK